MGARGDGRRMTSWSTDMSLGDLAARFTDEVKLRAFDKYIDRKEEREILQWAADNGVDRASAEAALWEVCGRHDCLVESALLKQVRELLEGAISTRGEINEEMFAEAVANLARAARGRLKERQCKRLVIDLVETRKYKTNTSLFSNWLKKARLETGMT